MKRTFGFIRALFNPLVLLALLAISSHAMATDMYAITANGDMLLYKHLGYRDGSANWWPGGGTKIGNGWNFRQVFAGSEGTIYAITFDGDMLFYRLLSFQDGAANWWPGGGTKIGNGWNFKQLFAGSEGAIYAITEDGDMLFYKHLGYRDGSANWSPGGGTKIGNGWNFKQVFAGSEGAIYAITFDGDMLFYRHLGYQDGTADWSPGGGTKIGNGWNFKQVFAGPEGAIYAITEDGDMLFYKHLGYRDGSANWWPGGGTKIGNGWNFVHLTASLSAEAPPPTQAQPSNPPTPQPRTAGLEARFDRPLYKNGPARLDVCDHFATFCGKKAADDYCQMKGYQRASSFDTEPASPTQVMNFGQECTGPGCVAFKFIVCSTTEKQRGPVHDWPHTIDPN